MPRIVAEYISRAACAEGVQCGVMGDAAKGQNGFHIWHPRNLSTQETVAGTDFRGHRFVFRRHAAHGVADEGVGQAQAVIGALFINTARKAEFEQSFKQQITGIITREGAACAVGTAQAGGQPHDQQTRLVRAEAGNGRVVPIGKGRALHIAESLEPGTQRAIARWVGGVSYRRTHQTRRRG